MIHRSIPNDWLDIINNGFDPPSIGEWFLPSREMPPSIVYRVKSVNSDDNEVVLETFPVRLDAVINCCSPNDNPNTSPTLTHASLDPFEPIRAQVIVHREGWICNGPLDTIELLSDEDIFINQSIRNKIVSVPISQMTVRNTTIALVPVVKPTFRSWNMTTVNWRRVWMWVWASYRDKKVSSFLWRLSHRALSLGYNRRSYADSSCVLCTNNEETYEHFIHLCPSASDLWQGFCKVWKQTSGGHQLGSTLTDKLFCSLPKRIYKGARNKWMVLAIAHGELLYSLWLQRCRAVFDNDTSQLGKHTLVAVAKHRIDRALKAVEWNQRWKSVMLTNLCRQLRKDMHTMPP
jgi:hypothetical protein